MTQARERRCVNVTDLKTCPLKTAFRDVCVRTAKQRSPVAPG